MIRRIHVSQSLRSGASIDLDPSQAHHIRDVLRLKAGDAVELFDDSGSVAVATLVRCDADHVTASVDQLQSRKILAEITIASAVPKGDRADWMIEKLSELGVSRFIPLATARSVVLPAGQNKRHRWMRIATESAKQSRRAGVMRIDELTPVRTIVDGGQNPCGGLTCYLSTAPDAKPIGLLSSSLCPLPSALLLIGPEGGWTQEEISLFESSHLTGVKLTGTILRVETAAVAAAAVVACLMHPQG